MNLTAAYAVEEDINRALKYPGRRLRLLKNAQPKGYEVIMEVFDKWCLYEESQEDPLRIRIAELGPVTQQALQDTVAFAVNERVYVIGDKIEPETDVDRRWTCHVKLNRKERVPLA